MSMFGIRFGKEDQAEQVFITKRLETSLLGTKWITLYISCSLQAQAFIWNIFLLLPNSHDTIYGLSETKISN